MADQASLRLIGLALGAVTAAVMVMAAVAVVSVDRMSERPAAVLVTTTG